MKDAPGFIAYLALAVLALMIIGALLSFASTWGDAPNTVTLQAPAASDGKVYLFHELREGPDVGYSSLPDGTRCVQNDRTLYRLGSGETALFFYRLDCDGVIGYVNKQWVR